MSKSTEPKTLLDEYINKWNIEFNYGKTKEDEAKYMDRLTLVVDRFKHIKAYSSVMKEIKCSR